MWSSGQDEYLEVLYRNTPTMNRDFVFDTGEFGSAERAAADPVMQSPLEFSGYSAVVKDEHAKRITTSLDHKISELRSRKQRRAEKIRQYEELRKKAITFNRRKHADLDDEEDDDKEENNLADGMGSSGDHVAVEEGVGAGMVEDALSEEGDETEKMRSDGVHTWGQVEAEEDDDSDDNDDADDGAEQVRLAVVIEEAAPEASGEHGKDGKRSPMDFFASSEGASFSATSFVELNISRPLIRACDTLGYKQPTPIQAACVPLGLTGRDICGSAVTGSGKTAAFGLPVLERLLYRPRRISAIRVLILTPTRELAVQVHSMLEKLAQFTDIRSCLIVGGLSSKVQEASLRSRPDIVVATPGRMIDHLHNAHSVGLEELSVLVLDEADRLLELGFSREIHELVRMCPRRRQTMLFSATMTEEVDELIKLSLNKPVRLSADPKTQRPPTLTEEVIKIRPSMEADREAILVALCARSFTSKVIVFSGTKAAAHRLKIIFGLLGMKAAELHGNLTQAMRLDALEVFRKQEADFLLATDVAARGLDIVGVETVINYECPTSITTYVHRVGRTARAGQQGCAVTFLAERDRALLKAMAKRGGPKLRSRIVDKTAVEKYRQKIEEVEADVKTIMQEERNERMFRKAEMEGNKAQNMMEYENEIYSRPKRVWFQSQRESKIATKAATDAKFGRKDKETVKKVFSIEETEELKKKVKRKRERVKSLPRKQRRRLDAEREGTEGDNDEEDEPRDETKSKGRIDTKVSRFVVDNAYRRANAAKGAGPGKLASSHQKESDKKKKASLKRKEDMDELFENNTCAGKKRNQVLGEASRVGSQERVKLGMVQSPHRNRS